MKKVVKKKRTKWLVSFEHYISAAIEATRAGLKLNLTRRNVGGVRIWTGIM